MHKKGCAITFPHALYDHRLPKKETKEKERVQANPYMGFPKAKKIVKA